MLRKAILFLGMAMGLSAAADAQKQCGTTDVYLKLKQRYPQIAIDEADLEQQIQSGLLNMPIGVAAKGTARGLVDTTTVYHIPVVFHIVHNYGNEYVSDNAIYEEVASMNRTYSRTNTSQLTGLVPPYNGKIPGTGITYTGNARIVFHLATIGPDGQPTNGITRHYSFQSLNAGDEAKFGIWPTNRYLNIWVIGKFNEDHDNAAAYAYQPFTAQSVPYGDGPIGIYNYLGTDNTFAHEVGHYLNLAHPWGNTNSPEVACGDDGVDDTPPTKGHDGNKRIAQGRGGCTYPEPLPTADINDTTCASGYAKTYTRSTYGALYGEDSLKFIYRHDTTFSFTFDSTTRARRDTVIYYHGLPLTVKYDSVARGFRDTIVRNSLDTFRNVTINYPDTTNAQNIMDYTFCSKMFTYGQVVRMRAALNSSIGGRDSLWTPNNLSVTGALSPRPDLAPIADFSVNRNFVCANTTIPANSLIFTDRSWRDTISSRSWTFGNGTPGTSTGATQSLTSISQTGWVNVALTANSNAGTNTLTRSDLLYAADPNAISPNGYYQEFEQQGGDVDMYPIFNYYGLTDYRWELSNKGYFDNSGIMMRNYDSRPYATDANMTKNPGGNYSDFYTRAFDLSASQFSGNVTSLTFYSAGAYRVVNPLYMNDSLQISYSTDCGNIWRSLGSISKGNLANNGYVNVPYYPTVRGEWKLNALTVPSSAKTSRVFFRFRYYSGTDNGEITGHPWGTGNNFFLDRINITTNAVGVNGAELAVKGMTLSPNPTTGAAIVTLTGGDNTVAQIHVMDITGKVVFQTEARLNKEITQIEIPASNIAVKGMYMVQAVTNGKAQTQKLVVY